MEKTLQIGEAFQVFPPKISRGISGTEHGVRWEHISRIAELEIDEFKIPFDFWAHRSTFDGLQVTPCSPEFGYQIDYRDYYDFADTSKIEKAQECVDIVTPEDVEKAKQIAPLRLVVTGNANRGYEHSAEEEDFQELKHWYERNAREFPRKIWLPDAGLDLPRSLTSRLAFQLEFPNSEFIYWLRLQSSSTEFTFESRLNSEDQLAASIGWQAHFTDFYPTIDGPLVGVDVAEIDDEGNKSLVYSPYSQGCELLIPDDNEKVFRIIGKFVLFEQ